MIRTNFKGRVTYKPKSPNIYKMMTRIRFKMQNVDNKLFKVTCYINVTNGECSWTQLTAL